MVKGDTGYFFYLKDNGSISGYELKRGVTVDVFGGGSYESEKLREALDRIAFEPFDFESEASRLTEIADKYYRGKLSVPDDHLLTTPVALDGAEFEIRLIYGSADYRLKRWNPGVAIDYFAPVSPEMAKLKAVLELFALSYGRTKFGF